MTPPSGDEGGRESVPASGAVSSRYPGLTVQLPGWVDAVVPDLDHVYPGVEERMGLVIELSRLNVEHGTGGPFGAAIFDMSTRTLIAPGVNVVLRTHWSGGHAEMVAYAIAQQVLGSHDLGGEGLPAVEIVSSTEPCSMCLGATPWSGVRRLVCGARDEDARAVGFDEGPKPGAWVAELEVRGIEVVRDVLRARARAVLSAYVSAGGPIYNGRHGG